MDILNKNNRNNRNNSNNKNESAKTEKQGFKRNDMSFIPKYQLLKPNFSQEEKSLLEELRNNLVDLAISSGDNFQINESALLGDIKEFLKLRFSNEDFNESNYIQENIDNVDKLASKLFEEIIGYGEIDPLIKDDSLEEIMVIGTNKPVFVYHREYGMMESNLIFKRDEEIISIIDSIARQINRRIDQESPILDARLADGSRVNATIPPVSADGPSITIRKFKKDPLTIIDLIRGNTVNSDLAAFLWLCVDGLGVKPNKVCPSLNIIKNI